MILTYDVDQSHTCIPLADWVTHTGTLKISIFTQLTITTLSFQLNMQKATQFCLTDSWGDEDITAISVTSPPLAFVDCTTSAEIYTESEEV